MQAFHGERELFRSDHTDWALASTIQNKCRVHNLKAYQVMSLHRCHAISAQLCHGDLRPQQRMQSDTL